MTTILLAVAVSYAALLILHFAVVRACTVQARREGEEAGYRKGFASVNHIKRPVIRRHV